MKKIFFVFVLGLFLAVQVSALSVFNIYIDGSGDAVFLGETDEAVILPSGVDLNGGIVSGITSDLTSKNGDLWTFSFALIGSDFNVFLPVGSTVTDFSDGEVFLQDDRIVISSRDVLEISYMIDGSRGTEAGNSSLSILLIIILIALVFVIVVYFVNFRNREKPVPKKKGNRLDIIKQVLSKREKLILDKLKETGKVKSSYLRKLCDIPKASFSRHVQELEKKRLIERSGEGKNKFVELK